VFADSLKNQMGEVKYLILLSISLKLF